MPRVPYVYPDPGESPIADKIRARRGPDGFLPLDGVLLNAPPIAEGWNSMFGAIRNQTSIPGSLREMIICRVAVLNDAAFEWEQHATEALKEGVSHEKLAVVRDSTVRPQDDSDIGYLEGLVLAATDELTTGAIVSDHLFSSIQNELAASGQDANRQWTEIVATISGYNMVSRFLKATNVGDRNEQLVPLVCEVEVRPELASLTMIRFTRDPNAHAAPIFILSWEGPKEWSKLLGRLTKDYNVVFCHLDDGSEPRHALQQLRLAANAWAEGDPRDHPVVIHDFCEILVPPDFAVRLEIVAHQQTPANCIQDSQPAPPRARLAYYPEDDPKKKIRARFPDAYAVQGKPQEGLLCQSNDWINQVAEWIKH